MLSSTTYTDHVLKFVRITLIPDEGPLLERRISLYRLGGE